jgi:nucleotide-binding universal stress UspA family protein
MPKEVKRAPPLGLTEVHPRPAMYKHILIATDGSELAEKAVNTGLTLAKVLGARATAVTVSEPWAAARTNDASVVFPFDAYETAAAEAASKIFASVRKLAKQLDVECATIHVKEHTAEGILQAGKNRGCDLIVMASHGRRGLSRLLLGSQATRVLTHSSTPVLICK